MATEVSKPRIEPVQTEDDVTRCHHCAVEAFARQTNDGFWCAFNPGWATPEGEARGARRLVARWRASLADGPGTRDAQGRPHTIILKAVLPEEGGRPETVAGVAIWTQVSFVAGHGVVPAEDLGATLDLEALYPGNPAEQRYLRQLDAALHRPRVEAVREKAAAAAAAGGKEKGPPATAAFVLDMCAVDPAYQRRGLARALVQWGLDEAQRRGGIECITEGSVMGRKVYLQMGFRQEGGEMVFPVDDEFKDRKLPSNVFLRTGPPGQ